MSMHRRDVLKALSYTMAGLITTLRRKSAVADRLEVLERDVCIIGGGSSGSFAAVQLRNAGKSVAVIERSSLLGGHTNTYRDPKTGTAVDYGVVVFHDLPVVTSYFAQFNVPLTPLSPGGAGGTTLPFDFRTGKLVTSYTPPTQAAQGAALAAYFGYLEQLNATYYDLDSGFDLPTPIPADLLMPFGDFVIKYSLQALVMTVFDFGQGLGNLLATPTVYVLKNFSAQVVSSIFAGKFLGVANGNDSIYQAVTQFLGSDVLFDATIARVERHGDGVTLLCETPHGLRLVHAKQLLVTAPPTLQNLATFDLDIVEASTFARWRWNGYYTGLATIDGIPAGTTIANIGADTPYNLPALPALYAVSATQIPGLWDVKLGSATQISDLEVKARIVAEIDRLHDETALPGPVRFTGFKTYASHSPFELRVSADDIRRGFYTTLGSLQGRNHTFYTGAAFHTHDSSLLWQFTQSHVLPLMLK